MRKTHVSHASLKERAALWLLVEFWKKNDPAGNGSQSNTTQQGLGKGEGAGGDLGVPKLCAPSSASCFPRDAEGLSAFELASHQMKARASLKMCLQSKDNLVQKLLC